MIITIQEELPLIPFDFSLLEILLCNVLLNAANYSPTGSTIEVEAKIEGEKLRLCVKDQGQGIPSNLLNTIFQKFYKIPGSPSEGMGLGLPIAKAIAELHHGTLEARNRPEGGSEFYLLLPLKQITFDKQRKLRVL
jgi:two-component system sensor histidine kinase KdpD